MRVTVLGASGQLGRELVARARAGGLRVRAVWRREFDFDQSGVEVAIEPDVLALEALRRVTADAAVVFSAVGQRRRRPRNPWSRLLSPPDLGERLARALDAALGARSPSLVVVSAAGVGDSRACMNRLLRALFDHSSIGIGYRDLANMERVLAASGRDCLIVRPTTLTHGRGDGWRRTERFRLLSRVSRRAVADCMVASALDGAATGLETVMITGR